MSDLLLPSGSRLLHIGPHKTGSTAIQVALFEVRDQLAEFGAWVPSGAHRRREASQELFAARTAIGAPLPLWRTLVEEVSGAGDVRACVSDELFGKARASTVAKIVRDLGGDRSHVLAVARRYDAYLPSQWQERVKAGRTETYDAWLRIVFGSEPHWERANVWKAHDTPSLARRWVKQVGPERFWLVAADESDHGQQPRLFEQMLGLPRGLLVPDPQRSNRSLAAFDVELIRRVNMALTSRGRRPRRYRAAIMHRVRQLAAERGPAPGPHRLPMPKWAQERVQELSEKRLRALSSLSFHIVGDVEHLAHVTDHEDDGCAAGPVPKVPDELVTQVVAAALGAVGPPTRR